MNVLLRHALPATHGLLRLIPLMVLVAAACIASMRAWGQAIITTGGSGAGGLFVLQGFPDVNSLCPFEVSGLPSFIGTHSLTYAGPDLALSNDLANSKIYVVKISTAAVVDTINMSGVWNNGFGSLAVPPAGDYALLNSNDNKLIVIKAPFTAASVITNVTLPATYLVPTFQTQAIDFDAAGHAYVYMTNNSNGLIAVLNPPYTSVAFSMPVTGNVGGAITVSSDGKTILATIGNSSGVVNIFHAPFSAASVPEILNVPIETSGFYVLDPIRITPDGTKALVAEGWKPRLYVINAPFHPESVIEKIPLPAGLTEGFEDIDISADGLNAIVSGQDTSNKREPLIVIRGPFDPVHAVVQTLDVAAYPKNGRGAGSARFRKNAVAQALTVYKCAPASVIAGQDLTYEFHVLNNNAAPVTSVVLRDTVPAGTVFMSATDGGIFAAGQVSWNVGTIPAGGAKLVYMTVKVLATAGDIVNQTYSVQAGAATPIVGPKTTTRVALATITQTAPATVQQGVNYTYTFHYVNSSTTQTFTSARVFLTLPNNVTYVSTSPSATHFSGGPVQWTLGTVAPGASGDLMMTVTAPDSPDVVTNNDYSFRANELPVNEPGQPLNTQVLAPLKITGQTQPRVWPGGNMSYFLTATNLNATAATGVAIDDALPAGTVFVTANSSGTLSAGNVHWNLGALAGNTSKIVRLDVKVTATAGKINNNGYYVSSAALGAIYGEPLSTTIPRPGAAVERKMWAVYE